MSNLKEQGNPSRHGVWQTADVVIHREDSQLYPLQKTAFPPVPRIVKNKLFSYLGRKKPLPFYGQSRPDLCTLRHMKAACLHLWLPDYKDKIFN